MFCGYTNNSEQIRRLMKKIVALLIISLFFQLIIGNPNPDIYSNLKKMKITQEIPAEAIHKILVISNRYFDGSDELTYAKYVHPQRKMFYFVVGMSTDSSYIKSFPNLEEAMKVFEGDKNFLIFVNGHGKNFGEVIGRGFEVGIRYKVNMIMFDWPTDYYALRKTAHNARKVTENFALTIHNLEPIVHKEFPNSNVSVIFHSMGNHIARNLVKKDLTNQIPEDFFDNLILNAPAVKQQNHANWVNQLNIQKRIYIVSNKDDFPLKGAMLLRMSRQLGSVYNEPLAKNAFYVNFSNIGGQEHNLFLGHTLLEKGNPNILVFYNTLFQGDEPMLNASQPLTAGKYFIDSFVF